MNKMLRTLLAIGGVVGVLASQGCVLAAAGAAGAAGGYAAKKNGYEVQSPVKKDTAGGYKPQKPVYHDPAKDENRSTDTAPRQQ